MTRHAPKPEPSLIVPTLDSPPRATEGTEERGCRLRGVRRKGASLRSRAPEKARALAPAAVQRLRDRVFEKKTGSKGTTAVQPAEIIIDKENLTRELDQFTGSLERTRHWTRRLIYTPGVSHLAAQAKAYWLIDLIAARQGSKRLAGETFQVWTLSVRPDRSATLRCDNGNGKQLLTNTIACTDFPLDGIVVWLDSTTLMLPSEY